MPLARLFLALFFLQAPKPGTVSGTVTNQVTGGGVRKAHITLRSGDLVYDATTDAEGHFSVAGVNPGGFYVRAECQGYEALQRAEPVRVAEDQHVEGVTLSLTPHGVITGRVMNENGEPLAGMSVLAQIEMFGRGGRKLAVAGMMQTDDRGVYRIFDLAAGRYLLLVTNPSLAGSPNGRLHVTGQETAYVHAWFPGVNELSQAAANVLSPGAELSGIDIRMCRVRVYHIRGNVVAQGVSRVDVPVQLSPCDNPVGAGSFAPVLRDGSFDAIDIMPGVWCAAVAPMNGERGWFGQQKVTVTDRDVNNVVITASPAADIHGQVMVNGETSATMQQGNVNLESTGPAGRGFGTRTGADGTFTFRNVPPDTYRLGMGVAGYLKGLRFNGQDSADGRITVTPAGGQLIVMMATDVGDISGTVQGPGIIVTAALAGSDVVAMAGVGSGSSFRMGNLAPGDYRVVAWESRDYSLTQYDEFRKQFDGRAATVTVHSNGHETASVTTVTAAEIEAARARLQ